MHKFLLCFYNIGRAFDRLVNTLIGGSPNHTISARMGIAIKAGKCRLCKPICRLLSLVHLDHCARAAAHSQKNPDGSDSVLKY